MRTAYSQGWPSWMIASSPLSVEGCYQTLDRLAFPTLPVSLSRSLSAYNILASSWRLRSCLRPRLKSSYELVRAVVGLARGCERSSEGSCRQQTTPTPDNLQATSRPPGNEATTPCARQRYTYRSFHSSYHRPPQAAMHNGSAGGTQRCENSQRGSVSRIPREVERSVPLGAKPTGFS